MPPDVCIATKHPGQEGSHGRVPWTRVCRWNSGPLQWLECSDDTAHSLDHWVTHTQWRVWWSPYSHQDNHSVHWQVFCSKYVCFQIYSQPLPRYSCRMQSSPWRFRWMRGKPSLPPMKLQITALCIFAGEARTGTASTSTGTTPSHRVFPPQGSSGMRSLTKPGKSCKSECLLKAGSKKIQPLHEAAVWFWCNLH